MTVCPFVSIICVTYNRLKFIPSLLNSVSSQTYRKDRFELIIVDDGDENIFDCIVEKKYDYTIKYYKIRKKMKLGEKRNFSHTLINKETAYVSYFDDDDVHSPCRLQHSVQMLISNPQYFCAGSSLMFVYFPQRKEMYEFGPYSENHATAGTFTFHVDLLKITSFDDNSSFAEESFFLKKYAIPVIQLNPLKTILVIAHGQNTVRKEQFIGSRYVKKSYIDVEFFTKNRPDKMFYQNVM